MKAEKLFTFLSSLLHNNLWSGKPRQNSCCTKTQTKSPGMGLYNF